MSESRRYSSLALALALALAQAACSATETADTGFNQVVGDDVATVSPDAFGGQDVSVPLPDGGVTDGTSTPEDGAVIGTDADPVDASVDGSPSDGAASDATTGDIEQDGALSDGGGPDDVTGDDVATDGQAPGDVAADAVGPDDTGTVPDCVESEDCAVDPDSLAICTDVACIEGACVEVPAKVGVACELPAEELLGGCTVGVCDEQAACVAQIVVDVPCEDGDPCTEGELCDASGACVGGSPLICSPPGPCQAAVCDAGVGGCVSFPSWEGQPCNDLDPCTTDTVCDSGVCAGGDNQCICETDEDCPDDGDLCNGTPVCALQADGGKACELEADSVVVCEAPDNPCLSVSCEPETGACVEKSLSGAKCEDDDLCTLNDICNDDGQCVGTQVACDDEDPCTADSCAKATGTCVFEPSSGASCSDGDVCTTGDVCVDGVCEGEDKLCDDANPCTEDACDAETGSCFSTATPGAACDDGNACTEADLCGDDGACTGEAISCEDDNPCTGIQCEPEQGCVYNPLDVPCDDGDACTGPDVCSDGGCEQAKLSCDDGLDCTVDSCDSETGCVHEAIDEACNDGNPCTGDACEPGVGCIFTPLSEGDCDDDSACTTEDSCVGGACVGKNIDCEDGVACTVNECDPAEGCVVESDASLCDDGNPCTDDACDQEAGCLNENNEAPCEDGSECTEGDTCSGGGCEPGENLCSCDPNDDPDLFWSADEGDGEDEFFGLFTETFSTLDASQSVTFSDTAAALTGASYTGQALSLEMDAIAGLNQPTVAWHLGGASIEGSALYLFWEDPEGGFHNLYCVEQNLWALDWNQSELDQIPYDCENGQLDFNVLGDYTFADDEAPQKLHLRMLIMAVPGGDTLYAYEVGVKDALFPSAACDDDNLCNGSFTCGGGGSCEPLEDPVLCDDEVEDPCKVSACDPETGSCIVVPVADGISCVDANPCTQNEICIAGECTSDPVECADDIPCTNDLCDPDNGGCTFEPVHENCSDEVSCTDNTCDPTQGCVFTPNASACDDGKPCTKDTCVPASGCLHEPVDSECDDGVLCTEDSCSVDFGCVFDPESSNCGDGNPCTNDLCLGGEGCVYSPTPGPCEDGNLCTVDDVCSNGVCTSGSLKPCESPNGCEAGQCEPATGQCSFIVLADGTACEDGNACSNPDVCDGGVCKAGPNDPCDDGIACTVDSCKPALGCVSEPDGGACDDGNPCTIDLCDPASGCVHEPSPEFSACSDGLDGTGPDVCVSGICSGFQTNEVVYSGDWFCDAYDSVGRALGLYAGQVFAVVNHQVEGFWCDGIRSQVLRLNGSVNEGVVVNSTNDTELTSMAYDGVFSADGEVGQFVWGVVSISYNLGDLIGAFVNQGEHYGAWVGHLKDGDDIKHRTYVVGENNNGNKGRIRRCIRTNDDDLNCTNVSNGLSNNEKGLFRPIAVDGLVVPDADCNDDASCDDLYLGLAAVSNDVDGLPSVIWGNDNDKFDYAVIDNLDEVFDVERAGESSVWISGDEGYLSHFDGDETWTTIEGPEEMQGLDLTSLGRISGHVLVAGHWEEDETGEAFLFVLPAGSEETDPAAWVTVPLGLNRQVQALHVDGEGLTLLGRQASPDTQPSVFVWYLKL